MFKELGQFIDDVGRKTYKLVSEEEEHRTAGICHEILEDLPEDLKRELEKGEEVVVRDHTKNNK